MRRCENCRFHVTNPDHCRRRPPTQLDKGTRATFAPVALNWWCGEHRFSFLKLLKLLTRKRDVQ